MTYRTPGKLILSGEHSVVYGAPALAVAIDRFVSVTLIPNEQPNLQINNPVNQQIVCYPLASLATLHQTLLNKHRAFLANALAIEQLLTDPTQLIAFTVAHTLRHLNSELHQGFTLHCHSALPIGCGMGSSAAAIISVIKAVCAHLYHSMPAQELMQLATECEHLQHGRSSSLDVHVCHLSGAILAKEQQFHPCSPPDFLLQVTNTGTPASTTGACVAAAKPLLPAMLEDFCHTTLAVHQALLTHQLSALHHAIRANHRLLVAIGVVPQRIQAFVCEVEKLGAVQKFAVLVPLAVIVLDFSGYCRHQKALSHCAKTITIR